MQWTIGLYLFWIMLWLSSVLSTISHAQQVTTNIAPTTGTGDLGTTTSQVDSTVNITGGTRPNDGPNLFHSFSEFSVGTGDTANFVNDTGLPTENILSRVTGGAQSDIFGTIQTTGFPGAGLFLLNPAGVVFGPNASLDVEGSFHVSTWDFIRLQDDTKFNAAPSAEDTLLTTASPEEFGFLDEDIAVISMQEGTLEVPESETLSVIGGDVEITGGTLSAPSGRINVVAGGEVNASGGTRIDVSGAGGEGILIRAGEFSLSEGSEITSTTTTPGEGGDISIKTTNSTTIDSSEVAARTVGDGRSGNIEVDAGKDLKLTNGGQIRTDSGLENPVSGQVISGQGKAGDIRVAASDSISISDPDNDPENPRPILRTGISSVTKGKGEAGDIAIVAPNAELKLDRGSIQSRTSDDGDAGSIGIDVKKLSLSNGSKVNVSSGVLEAGNLTAGQGKAGDLIIAATEGISVMGNSLLTSSTAGGDAGTVLVSTPGSLTIDGGEIAAITIGDGKGGDIGIAAKDVTITRQGRIVSNNFDQTGALIGTGGGDAGNIAIEATNGELTLDRGSIQSRTIGDGDAGDIGIDVKKLSLSNGSEVNVSSGVLEAGNLTAGQGDAGDIGIVASEEISVEASGLTTSTAGGAGGTMLVSTLGSLRIDGGEIAARTIGDGKGGDIGIAAKDVTITRQGRIVSDNFVTDRAGAFIGAGGGDAGKIVIEAPNAELKLEDRGSIQSRTIGDGDAGNIGIDVKKLRLSNGSQVNVSSGVLDAANNLHVGQGKAGDIGITATESITISDLDNPRPDLRTGIVSNTEGKGKAGNIVIVAPNAELELDRGSIQSRTSDDGDAGNIGIDVKKLSLLNGSTVDVNSGDIDSAGNLTAGDGKAGDIIIVATEGISVMGGSRLLSSTAGGDAGRMLVSTPGSLTIDGGAISAVTIGNRKGGKLFIRAADLDLTRGGLIRSSSGEAVNGRLRVGRGEAGLVDIVTSGSIQMSDSQIESTSLGPGNAGDIVIRATKNFRSENSSVTTEASQADGGDINLDVKNLVQLKDSSITASVGEGGDGGNVTIDPVFVVLDNSQITANAIRGDGGNINITTDFLFQSLDSTISASSERGIDGEVVINSPDTDVISNTLSLPESLLDASILLSQRCGARTTKDASSFVVSGPTHLPPTPEGVLSSDYLRDDTTTRSTLSDTIEAADGGSVGNTVIVDALSESSFSGSENWGCSVLENRSGI